MSVGDPITFINTWTICWRRTACLTWTVLGPPEASPLGVVLLPLQGVWKSVVFCARRRRSVRHAERTKRVQTTE